MDESIQDEQVLYENVLTIFLFPNIALYIAGICVCLSVKTDTCKCLYKNGCLYIMNYK